MLRYERDFLFWVPLFVRFATITAAAATATELACHRWSAWLPLPLQFYPLSKPAIILHLF